MASCQIRWTFESLSYFLSYDTVDHSLLRKFPSLSLWYHIYSFFGRTSFMGSCSSFCPLNVRVLRDSDAGHLLFYVFSSEACSSICIILFSIWIPTTHKYALSDTAFSPSFLDNIVDIFTWLNHKDPKLTECSYNSSSPHSSHKIDSSFSLLYLRECNQLLKQKP